MDILVKVDEAQQAATIATKVRRRTLLLPIGLVVLLVAAVWAVRWWTVGRFVESTDDAYLQADSVTVASKVSGYVTEVFVADNQTVTPGQALVRLDNRQYQAVLEQAQAAIAARKADIERGAAELLQQQANIAQARAQLQGARSSETHAAEEVKRYE
ncbi:MAG: biotin/lipoyl-binding protein, partial [Steroidobacteraceae bacterium]